MGDFTALPGLQPLAGGHSGETFVSDYGGQRVVVRLYGGRSASRGPDAARVDAAVMDLVRGLLPVPAVLEARAADPRSGTPGLLVTEFLPGERLEVVLPRLRAEDTARVGHSLGVLLGRLGHMVQPRAGLFAGADLRLAPMPAEYADLTAYLDARAEVLAGRRHDLVALGDLARDAQALLDTDTRTCLVHSDFNPKNLLVDPETLQVTGVLDWEFAHSGSPWSDLGNLLRFDREPAFVDGVLRGLAAMLPDLPADARARAGAADLLPLLELACREGQNPVADRAAARLREMTGEVAASAASRDLPPDGGPS